ncbi:MAG: DUF3558 family protein [Mycobacteriaceae bacterium]
MAAVGLLSGCAHRVEGTATAAEGPAPSPAPASPTPAPSLPRSPSLPTGAPAAGPAFPRPTGPAPPQRPALLPLVGVDSCTLLTDPERTQLGATGAPKADKGRCTIPLGPRQIVVDVNDRAAASYLDNAKVVGYPVGVGGYPAVVGWNVPDTGDACFVNLDVAEDANLEVGVLGGDGTGTAMLCPTALAAAGKALAGLQRR